MKITLKKVAIVLAVIFVMPFAYLAKAYWSTNNRMNKYYDVKKYAIAIPDDSASLALGAHLVKIKGCTDCHGENLGGRIFINDPKLAMLPAPNLTKGEGGLSHDYSTEDWVRALRHGLRRDGRSLLMMPSYEFVALTEKDLGSIIAYCQRLPAVDNKLPVAEIGPLGRVLTDLDKIPFLVAEMIDHDQPLVHDIEVGANEAFGGYLAISCSGCHRPDFKGGGPLAPGFPPVPDISSTGRISQWSEDQFFTLLRTGVNPDGKQVANENMPWQMTQHYTDTEIKALYAYLRRI